MKIAIMQPYFLPYIGYFQLINAVDVFVIYDDVNYIKKGWINRNTILVNGKGFLFNIPLHMVFYLNATFATVEQRTQRVVVMFKPTGRKAQRSVG